jgi:hypothetical protein
MTSLSQPGGATQAQLTQALHPGSLPLAVLNPSGAIKDVADTLATI